MNSSHSNQTSILVRKSAVLTFGVLIFMAALIAFGVIAIRGIEAEQREANLRSLEHLARSMGVSLEKKSLDLYEELAVLQREIDESIFTIQEPIDGNYTSVFAIKQYLNEYFDFVNSLTLSSGNRKISFSFDKLNYFKMSKIREEENTPAISFQAQASPIESKRALKLSANLALERFIAASNLETALNTGTFILLDDKVVSAKWPLMVKNLGAVSKCQIAINQSLGKLIRTQIIGSGESTIECSNSTESILFSFYPVDFHGYRLGVIAAMNTNEILKSGNQIIVIMSVVLVLFSAALSALYYFLVRIKDLHVNERREVESQMAHSSKLSSIGEMAAGIAHEINNPLGVIVGTVDLALTALEKDDLNRDKLKIHLHKIDKTAHRISKIINALRTFSRDGTDDPRETIAIGELINETADFVTQRFKNNEVNLSIEIEDSKATIEVSVVQIGQVIVNLLNNSFDAVTEGALAFEAISNGHKGEKYVRLWTQSSGKYLEILIEDNGYGVPDAVAAKIFEPFFTTKPVGKGTGLGLSIAAGIMLRHGGELQLQSRRNPTRFVLRLPLVTDIEPVSVQTDV